MGSDKIVHHAIKGVVIEFQSLSRDSMGSDMGSILATHPGGIEFQSLSRDSMGSDYDVLCCFRL